MTSHPDTTPNSYFRRHSALSDWLRPASAQAREAIIGEDLSRASRLDVLAEQIGLPVTSVQRFDGAQLQSPRFRAFVQEAEGAFAVRALHKEQESRILRNRNLPVPELLEWVEENIVPVEEFDLEFSPHVPNELACIFVVTDAGVIGEVTFGTLRRLTQGGPAGPAGQTSAAPMTCTYDFVDWTAVPLQEPLLAFIDRAVQKVRVSDRTVRSQLHEQLGASFAGEYLRGYFEAVCAPDGRVYFIDFNQALGRQLGQEHWQILRRQHKEPAGDVRGLTASLGRVRGRARLVDSSGDSASSVQAGDVLVCDEPVPDMVPLLAQAGGLVADRGGLLSHSAIVCRELRLPCLVATREATTSLPDGAMVELDADAGVVRVL